jgi:hypothetical protein
MNWQWPLSSAGALLGGGWLWRLRAFAAPGPVISLPNRSAPGLLSGTDFLECENFGDKVALNVEWWIRDYYNVGVKPKYELRRGHHTGPLKPGETFVIELGSCGTAELSDYEIFVSSKGPDGARFFSHFEVSTEVKTIECGLNRARWVCSIPYARVWLRRLRENVRLWRSPSVRRFR